jgi:hypothetical protein
MSILDILNCRPERANQGSHRLLYNPVSDCSLPLPTGQALLMSHSIAAQAPSTLLARRLFPLLCRSSMLQAR